MPEPHFEDPLALFAAWLAEAEASEPNDANAMALATADASGAPSVRMVLLKNFGPQGFTFHTNCDSRKGGELEANPRAALLFHWKSLRRQVRVEGPVAPLGDQESDAYFGTRSRESRIAAWASQQSRPLGSRADLDEAYAAAAARFEGGDVPRPPRWSGLTVMPERIEFWRDGAHRLHDRLIYSWDGDGWQLGRLYP